VGLRSNRMFLLQYGAERVPKALSLRGGSPALYWEPLFGVLVETPDGLVLFDTGMARDALDSEDVQTSYAAAADGLGSDTAPATWPLHPQPPAPERWNWGLGGQPLTAALGELGLRPADLSLAVISHLHLDHAGGIPELAEAGVEVAIQAAELDFASSGAVGLADGFHEADWSHPHVRWRMLSGDEEVMPGVRVLSTPGHTPGHSSLRVDLEDTGTWIFTADATDLAQNLLDAVPCGSCAAGTPVSERQADESLARLFAEAGSSGGRIIPGHDPVVLSAIRHPPGGHQ
jgi:N-acyl homoserine lactone hydrolase